MSLLNCVYIGLFLLTREGKIDNTQIVDADCRVFTVPVCLTLSFLQIQWSLYPK